MRKILDSLKNRDKHLKERLKKSEPKENRKRLRDFRERKKKEDLERRNLKVRSKDRIESENLKSKLLLRELRERENN